MFTVHTASNCCLSILKCCSKVLGKRGVASPGKVVELETLYGWHVTSPYFVGQPARQLSLPSLLFVKWVAIHVFTWITEVETIQTAGYGYVRLYGSTGQCPSPRAWDVSAYAGRRPCLWRKRRWLWCVGPYANAALYKWIWAFLYFLITQLLGSYMTTMLSLTR